jgi:DNA invertase Pin-like site-specific DNA recombinase
MEKYKQEIEEKMRTLYNNLSEKDKRHYSAIEALKLGYGGVAYIARLFRCSRQTIYKGMQEIEQKQLVTAGKSRCPGGGRKGYEVKNPDIDKVFLKYH